jgi:acetyl esterase/lipase
MSSASRLRAWGLLAVALMATAATARAADEPKSSTAYDVTYTTVDGQDLKLDIVRPTEGDGPFPVVFVIHGGAWRGGNKTDTRPALKEMAKRGYVAVSPQYRLIPKAIFPAQVHDVKAAVRWIKVHAKDYQADPAHIGAIGFSAGGHLALMLGVTAPDDGLEGNADKDGPDSRIQAVVNYFGPTDLAAKDIPDVSKPLLNDFLGGTPSEKAEVAKQASPVTFVTKDDAPVLTFQGTKDPLVPPTQAVKLANAMSAAGVPGRVELLIGAGHGWQGDELARTLLETTVFLNHYLKPASK